MKKLKTVKRGSAFCLIFAVLFLCAATAYYDGAGLGQAGTTVVTAEETEVTEQTASMGAGTISESEDDESESENSVVEKDSSEIGTTSEGNSGKVETEENTTTQLDTEQEDSTQAGTEQEGTEQQGSSQTGTEQEDAEQKDSSQTDMEQEDTEQKDSSQTDTPQANTEQADKETIGAATDNETATETSEKSESESDPAAGIDTNSENNAESEKVSESETESETEKVTEFEAESETETESEKLDLSFFLDDSWQDCALYRPGQLARVASATVRREDDEIFSYLDFPCYFKYVTDHGQDIGSKILAAYCVYNTREAPQKEEYVPDGKYAFSKEITYCLYNGCRYRGKTAYNDKYSTGNWKKDYYITQIAIHLINHDQGRESSIESYLNKSSDTEVYNLVNKMVKDAYADSSLTSSTTRQTQEVTYTVKPSVQEQWIKQDDGTWRTVADYTCTSNLQSRVVTVTRTLNSDAPSGTAIVVNDVNDPLSSFYFTATPEAYRQIAQKNIKVTATLKVTAEEYGGWWYEPADSSVKRQYVTFLTLEAAKAEEKASVTATADYFEQLVSLTIYKEGEMLTGASSNSDGVQFQYAKKRLSGAGFELRSGAEIKNGAGEVIWQKDAVVAGNLVTGAEGTVTVENLYPGDYYLVEKTAPAGTVLDTAPHAITLMPENDSTELTLSSVVLTNKRQKLQITVEKTDSTTEQPLAGAIFGVYAGDEIRAVDGTVLANAGTLLGKAVTETDGKAVFQCDLPVGHSYYLKELQAPSGYIRDEQQQYNFTFWDNPAKEVQQIAYSCTNVRCQAELLLEKRDKETGEAIPQGDASLIGAQYGLYARDTIEHSDGHTGVIYEQDQQVAVLETDEQGKAQVGNLYLGNYYLKELTAPEGYVLDEQEHDISFTWENDVTAVFQKTAVMEEQVKKQAFQIIKGSDKGDAQPDALQGAGFTVWLLSDLAGSAGQDTDTTNTQDQAETGYDTSGIEPVVIGANGERELFTDEDGYLCTVPLPYGIYLVRETTVPQNHKPVKDFIVTVSEHSPEQPQPWRILLDESFMAKLKIVKKDSESGKPILVPGAEFRVKNQDTGEYVEQETSYPEQKVHTSYFTNEEGYLILAKELEPGRYLVEEITAPEGYVRSSEPVEITIEADVAFQEDPANGAIVFVQEFYNTPVRGTLQIEKRGNVLTEFEGVFQYEESALAGVAFEILAEEDILSPDGQKTEILRDLDSEEQTETDKDSDSQQQTEDDDRAVLYKKGTVITTVVTDEEGKAAAENLPLGTYRIREKQAPFGFVTDTEGIVVTLAYEGQEIPVVVQETPYYNERQQLLISLEKKDQDSGKALPGAVFGLYAAADICNAEGTVIVSAWECLNQVTTDQDGMASFDLELPHGLYCVKEEQAPAGYVTDANVYEVDLRECDGTTKVISETLVVENQITQCEISKTDITSGDEIPGATLELRNEKGELVERWISGDKPHSIKGLQPGSSYTLTELQAPYGYVLAETITFTIEDTGEIQQVEMQDDHAFGKVQIQKEDASTGEALSGAVFELRDESGKVLETLKTDEKGMAESSLYEIGTYQAGGFTKSLVYILEEVKAPEGYQLDSTKHEIIFAYEDEGTPEVVWKKTLKNEKAAAASAAQPVQTGDHTDVFGLLCMLFLSGEAFLALLFFRRKLK